jgi:hypothetical protein
MLAERAKAILAKAEECHDLAKTQHEIADAQHQIAARLDDGAKRQRQNADAQEDIANKLDALGRALTADAVEAMGEATGPQL